MEDFLGNEEKEAKPKLKPAEQKKEEFKKEDKIPAIKFDMKEIELVEAYKDNFLLNWAYTHVVSNFPNISGEKIEE